MASGSQYEFGSYCLDVPGGTLFREGKRVPLSPKAAELLVALVEAAGSVLTREQLLLQVWPGIVIEEGSLSSHISMLRKSLGTAPNGQDFIETLPKRGYRFAADVKRARLDVPGGGIDRAMLGFWCIEGIGDEATQF
jgi:DNA-binding winged helix-turn-helix (wHTH) protein